MRFVREPSTHEKLSSDTVGEEVTRELEHSVSLLQATLDATADGVLAVGIGKGIVAVNRQFFRLWRIPDALACQKDDKKLLAFVLDQLENPEEFLQEATQLAERPEAEQHDVIHFKDGRVFERHTMPQKVGGRIVGSVKSFRDVTERERWARSSSFLLEATRLLNSLDIEKALEGVAHLALPTLGDACWVDLIKGGQAHRLLAVGNVVEPTVRPDLGAGAVIFESSGREYLYAPVASNGQVEAAFTFAARSFHHYQPDDVRLAEELAHRTALSSANANLYRQAREALKLRDEFLSIVAHEIRGPIMSLNLAAQGLRSGAISSAKAPQVLHIMETECGRLSHFVDDLLNLGRIRAGQFTYERTHVDLAKVVRDAAAGLEADLSRSGSTLQIRSEGETSGNWDGFRLEQVVKNLLSNAFKFGQGKPIEVTVRQVNGKVELQVRDHGIGIQPARIPHIFDPFQRAVSVRNYGGLGLGLYIVRNIVEAMGGCVRVVSEPDFGSTFLVELPPNGKIDPHR